MPRSGICRYCRCTDVHACDSGCSWIDRDNTVCSSPVCVLSYANQLASDLKRVLLLLKNVTKENN